MKFKAFVAASAVLLAAPAMAATCTEASSWGSLGPPGERTFSQTFSSRGNYLDCYSFSLTSAATSSGGVYEDNAVAFGIDWSWLNIDVTSVKLFSGGVLGGQTIGSLIGSDNSASSFSFGALSAGTYTLAIASSVTKDWWGLPLDVGYGGKITTSAVSVASPAPEPAALAMMVAGLAGVGMVVRRRKKI